MRQSKLLEGIDDREVGKESFLEAFLPEGIGRNDSLERIGEVVPGSGWAGW